MRAGSELLGVAGAEVEIEALLELIATDDKFDGLLDVKTAPSVVVAVVTFVPVGVEDNTYADIEADIDLSDLPDDWETAVACATASAEVRLAAG